MNLPPEHSWKPALLTPHWRPAARSRQGLGQTPPKPYGDVVVSRLVEFGAGTVISFIGASLLRSVVPGLRLSRRDAVIGAGIAALVGAVSIALPFQDTVGKVLGSLSMASGIATGISLSSVAFPKKK